MGTDQTQRTSGLWWSLGSRYQQDMGMEVPASAPSAGAWEEPHWCQCRARPLTKALGQPARAQQPQTSQGQLPRVNPTACSHGGLGAAWAQCRGGCAAGLSTCLESCCALGPANSSVEGLTLPLPKNVTWEGNRVLPAHQVEAVRQQLGSTSVKAKNTGTARVQ